MDVVLRRQYVILDLMCWLCANGAWCSVASRVLVVIMLRLRICCPGMCFGCYAVPFPCAICIGWVWHASLVLVYLAMVWCLYAAECLVWVYVLYVVGFLC